MVDALRTRFVYLLRFLLPAFCRYLPRSPSLATYAICGWWLRFKSVFSRIVTCPAPHVLRAYRALRRLPHGYTPYLTYLHPLDARARAHTSALFARPTACCYAYPHHPRTTYYRYYHTTRTCRCACCVWIFLAYAAAHLSFYPSSAPPHTLALRSLEVSTVPHYHCTPPHCTQTLLPAYLFCAHLHCLHSSHLTPA